MSNLPDDSDLKAWVVSTLETFDSIYSQRLQGLENIQEQTERQLALLTSAYAELVVMVEALLNQLVGASDEDKERFRNDVTEGRKKMLEVLHFASSNMEQSSDRFTPVVPEPSEGS